MARAIIRYSLEGDSAGTKRTRNSIRERLAGAGFEHLGTGSWEFRGAELGALIAQLRGVLEEVENLPPDSDLDHIWLYIDRVG
jgi:hypothetical protein